MNTQLRRKSDTEIEVTRVFDAPAHLVFQAWTTPALLRRWWAPRSMGMELTTCEVDARTGGAYRFRFSVHGEALDMDFVGQYREVTPYSRIVWTNEEDPGGAVTTVTLVEQGGQTLVTVLDTYPSKAALEANQGAEQGLPEQYAQLDDLLTGLAAT